MEMLPKTLNKTVRFTKEDALGIRDIMMKDPKAETASKALYYAFKDAHENGFFIKQAANYHVKSDKNEVIDEAEYASPRSFSVEQTDWEAALEAYRTQLGVERVRISSLARLVIRNYRRKLKGDPKPVKEEIKNIDAIELLQKAFNHIIELAKAGEWRQLELIFGEE